MVRQRKTCNAPTYPENPPPPRFGAPIMGEAPPWTLPKPGRAARAWRSISVCAAAQGGCPDGTGAADAKVMTKRRVDALSRWSSILDWSAPGVRCWLVGRKVVEALQ